MAITAPSVIPTGTVNKTAYSYDPVEFDWTDWLFALVESGGTATIAASSWVISCADEASPTLIVRAGTSSIITNALKTVCTLEGGTEGKIYTLENRITASSGARETRWIRVRVDAVGS